MRIVGQFDPLAPIESVVLFRISAGRIQVPFTNHMLMIALAAAFLGIVVPLASRQMPASSRRLQTLIESICVFLRDQMARPILGTNTDRYIGFVWTVFFFVLTLNLLGMIPSDQILTALTGRQSHWGGPATANIYVTGALAIVGFFMALAAGIRQQGLAGYLIGLVPQGPLWARPLLFLIEVIGLLVRPFTLAVRLFANILAGHIVMATFFGLILIFKNYLVAVLSVTAAVAVSLLELLVAFVQAYIFAFLTALYIGLSVSSAH